MDGNVNGTDFEPSVNSFQSFHENNKKLNQMQIVHLIKELGYKEHEPKSYLKNIIDLFLPSTILKIAEIVIFVEETEVSSLKSIMMAFV